MSGVTDIKRVLIALADGMYLKGCYWSDGLSLSDSALVGCPGDGV